MTSDKETMGSIDSGDQQRMLLVGGTNNLDTHLENLKNRRSEMIVNDVA